jgi:hypothetical protein
MGTRKTAAERREEARDFVEYGPRGGDPGSVLYTNLGYYLRNDLSPERASQWAALC